MKRLVIKVAVLVGLMFGFSGCTTKRTNVVSIDQNNSFMGIEFHEFVEKQNKIKKSKDASFKTFLAFDVSYFTKIVFAKINSHIKGKIKEFGQQYSQSVVKTFTIPNKFFENTNSKAIYSYRLITTKKNDKIVEGLQPLNQQSCNILTNQIIKTLKKYDQLEDNRVIYHPENVKPKFCKTLKNTKDKNIYLHFFAVTLVNFSNKDCKPFTVQTVAYTYPALYSRYIDTPSIGKQESLFSIKMYGPKFGQYALDSTGDLNYTIKWTGEDDNQTNFYDLKDLGYDKNQQKFCTPRTKSGHKIVITLADKNKLTNEIEGLSEKVDVEKWYTSLMNETDNNKTE